MSRISHLGLFMQHKNFYLFMQIWVLILSSALPATATGSPSGNGGSTPTIPKQRGGSTMSEMRPNGRGSALVPEPKTAVPPAPYKKRMEGPDAADARPPLTTNTPDLIASSKMGGNVTPAGPVLHVDVTMPQATRSSVHDADALATQRRRVVLALARAWAGNERVVKTLLAGAVSGVVSRSCTSPLEVVATLQMSGAAAAAGSSSSIGAQLAGLYAQGGARAFFRGNGANCLKVAPTRAIQFAVYERLKVAVLEYSQMRSDLRHQQQQQKGGVGGGHAKVVVLSPYGRLCAGGVAGMVAASFVYPLEVVKTMLTVAQPGAYKGILDAFRAAFASGGLAGFYKGWLPTMFAMFPYVGVEFMIYESFKALYKSHVEAKNKASIKEGKGGRSTELPPFMHLALGACAGAAAQTAAHPLDVVRRRLQMQGKNGRPVEFHNMFDCLYKMVTKEGVGALYRGLKPACAEKIPSTAVTFFMYEFLKGALGLNSL